MRSGRSAPGGLVDAQLTNLYQGLLAYGDADPQVDEVLIQRLYDRALAFRNLPCPPMCGTMTHSATGGLSRFCRVDDLCRVDWCG